jgi:hypothetical protein
MRGPEEFFMAMNCDLILQWNATPGQLTDLGAALWRCCSRAGSSVYQLLDNQALADLFAGRLPGSSPTAGRSDRRGVHFWFQGEASHDRQMTIGKLRREIPPGGVEDILINGKSWDLID